MEVPVPVEQDVHIPVVQYINPILQPVRGETTYEHLPPILEQVEPIRYNPMVVEESQKLPTLRQPYAMPSGAEID